MQKPSLATFVRPLAGLLSAAFVVAAPTAPLAQSFQGLGYLPGTGPAVSLVLDMSADGAVVVGDTSWPIQAVRWTMGSWTGLGWLPGTSGVTEGLGVSHDGNVVVGYDGFGGCGGGHRGFKWTAGGGMVSLGFPAGTTGSVAYGANADGSVVVGQTHNVCAGNVASRWTSAGWVQLGVLPGYFHSTAFGTSADGLVVVGASDDSGAGFRQAFRWTLAGMTPLGFLSGGDKSGAAAVSADGVVVVGSSTDSSGNYRAFRWTDGPGMVSLGLLPGATSSSAMRANSDGTVIVGDSGGKAFRWTAADGMQSVKDLLTAAGVVNVSGWQLLSARGVSADGTVIAGQGINPIGQLEGWRATLPLPLLYTFIGFEQPLENLPFSNSTKAGSVVPIKWQLADESGNYVSDLAAVKSTKFASIACDELDIYYENAIDAETAGESGLQYDTVDEHFVYGWKTRKNMKDTCAVFILTLADGQQHHARFMLK